MLNSLQFWSLFRQILIFAGGFAVAKGYVSNETMLAIVGAAISLGTSYVGLNARSQNNMIADVAAMTEVFEIRTTAAIKAAIPDPTVTNR